MKKQVIEETTTLEKMRDIVDKHDKQGFTWDRDASQMRPCKHCGFIVLIFRNYEQKTLPSQDII